MSCGAGLRPAPFKKAVCSMSVLVSELGWSSHACLGVSCFSCSLVLLLSCGAGLRPAPFKKSSVFHVCVHVRIRLVVSRVSCSLILVVGLVLLLSCGASLRPAPFSISSVFHVCVHTRGAGLRPAPVFHKQCVPCMGSCPNQACHFTRVL